LPLATVSSVEREALTEFLLRVFGLEKTAPFIQPELLHWKYDEPRPDWLGPRSYAWMAGKEIAAHAGICPVTYRLPAAGRTVCCSYFIDWAAGRRIPGAGGLLTRKLAGMFDVLLAIGGSRDTQEILPKLGFRKTGEVASFARVMRPWRQFRSDPFPRGWKAPVRLARNWLWSRAGVPQAPEGWTCSRVERFAHGHEELLEAPVPFPATRRNAALMNYWLRCPGAAISAYVVSNGRSPRGWFLLSRVERVLRIADLRVDSDTLADWQAAYALATQAAYEDRTACELVAAASRPVVAEAIQRNGFHWRKADPVFALDPKGAMEGQAPLEITLMENDMGYLYTPGYPYLS
jgi:hypothetical protein